MRKEMVFRFLTALMLGVFISCSGGTKSGANQGTTPAQQGGVYDKTAEAAEQSDDQPGAAPGPGEDENPPETKIKGNQSK